MSTDLKQLAGCIADAPEGIMMCLDVQRALIEPLHNPLRRIWCVFEVWHCMSFGKPLVIKLGRAVRNESGRGVWHREWDLDQVTELASRVDVLKAEAT